MARYEIPPALKIALWICWWALLLAYGLAPLYMGPVDPPADWP